jgi:hypothetical protein
LCLGQAACGIQYALTYMYLRFLHPAYRYDMHDDDDLKMT